jgi:hypothetical protein
MNEEFKLYMFHCGFYPSGDIYEQHKNFFIADENLKLAERSLYNMLQYEQDKTGVKYHVDGVQLIEMVEGWRVKLEHVPEGDEHYGWTILRGRESIKEQEKQ